MSASDERDYGGVHVNQALVKDSNNTHAKDPDMKVEEDDIFTFGIPQCLKWPPECGETPRIIQDLKNGRIYGYAVRPFRI